MTTTACVANSLFPCNISNKSTSLFSPNEIAKVEELMAYTYLKKEKRDIEGGIEKKKEDHEYKKKDI